MSAIRTVVTVYRCDEPACAAMLTTSARGEASRAGWILTENYRDICPACAKRKQDEGSLCIDCGMSPNCETEEECYDRQTAWCAQEREKRTAARNAAILHDANHDCREGR